VVTKETFLKSERNLIFTKIEKNYPKGVPDVNNPQKFLHLGATASLLNTT
jgi:hypothetical protein